MKIEVINTKRGTLIDSTTREKLKVGQIMEVDESRAATAISFGYAKIIEEVKVIIPEKIVPVKEVETTGCVEPIASLSFVEIRKIAKAKGISTFQKNKRELLGLIESCDKQ